MAISKNFVVKNGLEVNDNLILANIDTNRVGIGTTQPLYTLDVRGGFGATDVYVAGVSTFVGLINANNGLNVTGHTELDNVNSSGVATFASLDVNGLSDLTNVIISGVTTFFGSISGLTTFSGGIDVVGKTELDNVNISGISTISALQVTGVSTFTGLIDSNGGLDVTGHTELDNANISGIATVASLDVNGLSDLTNVNVSGAATFSGGVVIQSGIITSANPGVTTVVYYGDGRYLEGVIGGVGIATTGGIVGTGVTILNFVGSGVSSIVFNSVVGIATINISGGGGDAAPTSKTTTTFTATSGQTTFSVSYAVGSIDVYLNGVRLSETEYTATNGTTVVLAYAATAGDIIDIVVFDFGNSLRGIQGTSGSNGAQGIQGLRGLDGAFAAQGIQGIQGRQGVQGIQGLGIQGVQGIAGEYAAQGIQGAQGTQGIQGFSFERIVTSFTANSGQTTFYVSYAIGTVDVYLNGVRLSNSEYTATNGTTVVLTYAATAGDYVDIISFQSAGPQGVQGPQGPQGVQGLDGLFAAQGIQGVQGVQGGTGTVVADDTSTNSQLYVLFTNSTSGLTTTFNISSTKLTFNPSDGRITAVDFNSTSDQRLKENIQPLSNSIEVLNKINPVEFSWKETGDKSYGVIAQELENILPELVKDGEEYKSVSYIPLIALLIDSIKEHQKEIEILKSKIDN